MPTFSKSQLGLHTPYKMYGSNELGALAPGGDVLVLTASGTLKVGDVVYVSAAGTVAISTTASNHDKIIGVVVGGQAFYESIVDDSTFVGSTAATTGQYVYVLIYGIAYVVCEAAIAAGVSIVGGTTTAGRVKAMTVGTGTAANPTQATSTAANPTQATTTAANPTQATITVSEAAATIPTGVTAVLSTAQDGAIVTQGVHTVGGGALTAGAITNGAITAGAITNGAITAGAVTLAGEGSRRSIGKLINASSGAAVKVLAFINP